MMLQAITETAHIHDDDWCEPQWFWICHAFAAAFGTVLERIWVLLLAGGALPCQLGSAWAAPAAEQKYAPSAAALAASWQGKGGRQGRSARQRRRRLCDPMMLQAIMEATHIHDDDKCEPQRFSTCHAFAAALGTVFGGCRLGFPQQR
jgi:hypothetical protein